MPFWKLLLWGFHRCFSLYFISLPGLYVSCPAVGAKWGWSEGLPLYRRTNYLPALGLVMGRGEHRILETHSLTASPFDAAHSHFSLYWCLKDSSFIFWMCITSFNILPHPLMGVRDPSLPPPISLLIIHCSSLGCLGWAQNCTINAIFMDFFPFLYFSK